jgi:glycerol-3-phosphate dehydrogenase
MSPELDLVIIGGGIQGLLAQESLEVRGYACALVAAA